MTGCWIEAVNTDRLEALTADGLCLPITLMLDAEGDETHDWAEAVVFVAGAGSRWHVEGTSGFVDEVLQ